MIKQKVQGIGVCLLMIGLVGPLAVYGQGTPMVNPDDLGLRLPMNTPAKRVEDHNVVVPPEVVGEYASEPVVANVYLEVGNRFVVMLPNGALRSVEKTAVTTTDRPFEATKKKQMAADLLKQFKGFKTKSTRRYLSVYNTSDGFCERKLAILETMYPMLYSYFRRQGFDVHAPAAPMVVVMFNTKQEFLKFREMPESILAYYNTVSNRVFLYHHSEIETKAPLIALKQSTSTIAHEGVHQILHNIGVQSRLSRWPMWISEGLPEYLSPTSVGRRKKWGGVGVPNDLRMRELFEHLNGSKARLGAGNVIRDILTAERLSSDDYAIAWALTHYLATKRRDEFFEYLREVSTLEPLADPGNDMVRFVHHLGEGFAEVEKGMLKHVKSLPYTDPYDNQPYFVVTAMSPRYKAAKVTSSTSITKIKKELLKEFPAPERNRVRFNVHTFPNRQVAERQLNVYIKN